MLRDNIFRRQTVAWGKVMSRIQSTTVVSFVLCCALALPSFSYATGKKYIPKNPLQPQTVVIERTEHDGAMYALVGAGVTYWLWHRYHKKHPRIERVIEKPEPLVCEPTTDVRIQRAEAACGK